MYNVGRSHKKLNPAFFSNTSFKFPKLIPLIKKSIDKIGKEYDISSKDLSKIFIIGENINGSYSKNTPLKVNLYFRKVITTRDKWDEFEEDLEEEVDKATKRLSVEFSVNTIDPKAVPRYFDLIKNRIINNTDYATYIKKQQLKQEAISEMEKHEKEIQEIAKGIEGKQRKDNNDQENEREDNEEGEKTIKISERSENSENVFLVEKGKLSEVIMREGKKVYIYTKKNLEDLSEKIDEVVEKIRNNQD